MDRHLVYTMEHIEYHHKIDSQDDPDLKLVYELIVTDPTILEVTIVRCQSRTDVESAVCLIQRRHPGVKIDMASESFTYEDLRDQEVQRCEQEAGWSQFSGGDA